jgi:hypothetical protein
VFASAVKSARAFLGSRPQAARVEQALSGSRAGVSVLVLLDCRGKAAERALDLAELIAETGGGTFTVVCRQRNLWPMYVSMVALPHDPVELAEVEVSRMCARAVRGFPSDVSVESFVVQTSLRSAMGRFMADRRFDLVIDDSRRRVTRSIASQGTP